MKQSKKDIKMEKQNYRNKPFYGVWNRENSSWNHYESIEDAIFSEGDAREIFEFEPKFIGKFKFKAEIIKIKSRKKSETRPNPAINEELVK